MPFIILPNNEGKLYVPEQDSASLRKHYCKHCFSCQVCSDDRCRLCLNADNCKVPGATPSGDHCLSQKSK